MRVKTGIFLGMVSLLLAAILRGGGIDIRQMILFINIPSALLPAMGVIASMLVSYRAADIIRLLKECWLIHRNKMVVNEESARELARFHDSLGVYSIAWGVIITVVGFILMAANLYDTAQLSSGFAIAILSVYYGLIAAYLVFFPLSRRFEREWKKQ